MQQPKPKNWAPKQLKKQEKGGGKGGKRRQQRRSKLRYTSVNPSRRTGSSPGTSCSTATSSCRQITHSKTDRCSR